MPKFSFSAHPYLLGFEGLDMLLERSVKTNGDGYPPYNIEQPDEDRFRISLALAGFSICDLSVVVDGSQLVVRGERKESGNPHDFIHRGISERQFQRVFVLAECIEVVSAVFENGLLHLDLRRIVAEARVENIPILSTLIESHN